MKKLLIIGVLFVFFSSLNLSASNSIYIEKENNAYTKTQVNTEESATFTELGINHVNDLEVEISPGDIIVYNIHYKNKTGIELQKLLLEPYNFRTTQLNETTTLNCKANLDYCFRWSINSKLVEISPGDSLI